MEEKKLKGKFYQKLWNTNTSVHQQTSSDKSKSWEGISFKLGESETEVDPHHADLMNDNPFGLHFSSDSQIDSLNSDSTDQNDNPPGTDSDPENPGDLDISSENLVGLDNGPTNTVNLV